MKNIISNITSAFSDCAVLFPLLVLLVAKSGFSPVLLFASAGIAYCAAGLWFRVPMSVQPLKSVVIAAVTLGATMMEVRISAALVGLYCLLLVLLKGYRWADKVPLSWVHGLQVSLGIILALKGMEAVQFFHHWDATVIGLYFAALVSILFSSKSGRFSFLGLIATVGLLWGLLSGYTITTPVFTAANAAATQINWGLILMLVLPQLVLTSANSVIGTHIAAKHYFGDKARKVTVKNLLLSIGFGNLISASIGGLPFCHGAGGLTAHVKGGSTHFVSNFVIGFFLIGLAVIAFYGEHNISITIPAPVLSLLLIAVGILHLPLAKKSWKIKQAKPQILLMGLTAVWTQNLLWALCAGIVYHLMVRKNEKSDFATARSGQKL